MAFGLKKIKVKKPWEYVSIPEKITMDREKIASIKSEIAPLVDKADPASLRQAAAKARRMGGIDKKVSRPFVSKTNDGFREMWDQVRELEPGSIGSARPIPGGRSLREVGGNIKRQSSLHWKPRSREDWEKGRGLHIGKDYDTYEEYVAAVEERNKRFRGDKAGALAHGINTILSGEAAYKEVTGDDFSGMPAPARWALDTALAPATIVSAGAGAAGVGSGLAGRALLMNVGKQFAKNYARETIAGTVGYGVGEKTAEQVAERTDNPYLVGTSALVSGVVAGGVAYNPKGAARLTGRAAEKIRTGQMPTGEVPVAGVVMKKGRPQGTIPSKYQPRTGVKANIDEDSLNAFRAAGIDVSDPNVIYKMAGGFDWHDHLKGGHPDENIRKLAYGATIDPQANSRVWWHSTPNKGYNLPNPAKGTRSISQGPGIYMAADPRNTTGYGGRSFAMEFDGKVANFVKPLSVDAEIVADGPSWRSVKNAIVTSMENYIAQYGYKLNPDKVRYAFEHIDSSKSRWTYMSAGTRSKDGVILANGYAYRDALERALESQPIPQGMINDLAGEFKDAGTKGIINGILAQSGVDAIYHYSARAEKDVLIGLNGDAFRVIADEPGNKRITDAIKAKKNPLAAVQQAAGQPAPIEESIAEWRKRVDEWLVKDKEYDDLLQAYQNSPEFKAKVDAFVDEAFDVKRGIQKEIGSRPDVNISNVAGGPAWELRYGVDGNDYSVVYKQGNKWITRHNWYGTADELSNTPDTKLFMSPSDSGADYWLVTERTFKTSDEAVQDLTDFVNKRPIGPKAVPSPYAPDEAGVRWGMEYKKSQNLVRGYKSKNPAPKRPIRQKAGPQPKWYALNEEGPSKGDIARLLLAGNTQGIATNMIYGGVAGFLAPEDDQSRLEAAAMGALTGGARAMGAHVRFAPNEEVIMSIAKKQVSNNNEYVANPRPLEDIAKEVNGGNKVAQLFIGKTGINPSILEDNDLGKTLVAYLRQQINVENMTEAAVSGALDKYSPGFKRAGVMMEGSIWDIDEVGKVAGTDALWQDVFTGKKSHNLTQGQENYILDFQQVVDELDKIRIDNGLDVIPRNPDGSFYVPQYVKTVKGVEVPKAADVSKFHMFEDAQEGYDQGFRFNTDPRATLALYAKSTYKEILGKQLNDAIDGQGVPLSKLVPPATQKVLKDAQNKARKMANDLKVQLVRQEADPDNPAIKKLVTAAKSRNTKAKNELARAQLAYGRAKDAAAELHVAPGFLFGQQEAEIPVAMWRNRFYTKEDHAKLVKYLGHYSGAAQPTANPLAKAFEVTGNVVRTTASIGDLAMPFVHGLPMLASNPIAWGKMAFRHYQAFIDPTVRGRYMAQHMETVQALAKNGVAIGDTEFFLGAENVASFGRKMGGISPVAETATKVVGAGLRQTAGRFQSAYNTGLLAMRVELWEALRPTWKGTETELGQYIRNMSGGLDPRALAVGPNQRALESVWLAFSPRLLRSTIGLVADARNIGRTASGTQSALTLMKMAAGVTAFYVGAGMAMGKSREEIQTGLNPTSGKKFLSFQINGDWIGVGGQMRALTQLGAKLITDPTRVFTTTDQQDNPLIAFYMSRGAPAINLVGGAVEAFTGANVMKYDDIDNPADLVMHIGKSAMPFAIQNVIEGQNVESAIAGFFGARTSIETTKDKMDKIARDKTEGKVSNFYDLTEAQQAEVRKENPDLWKKMVSGFSEERQKYYAEKEKYAAEQVASDEAMLSGQLTRDDWIKQYEDRNLKLIGAGAALLGDKEARGKMTPVDDYYKAIDASRDATGAPNWDEVEMWIAAQPADKQKYIEDNTGVGGTPVVQLYRQSLKERSEYFQLSKYRGYSGDQAFDIDAAWQEVRNNSKSAEDYHMLISLRSFKDGMDPEVYAAVRKRILGTLRQTKDREKYLKSHPKLKIFFGRGKLTQAEVEMLKEPA